MIKLVSMILLAGLTTISGCYSARPSATDLPDVAARYRPDGAMPVLPSLTPDSPFSDFLTYALLNNPRVEAAFYVWNMSVEDAIVAGSLPNPQLKFSAEIASAVEKLLVGFMQELPGPGKLALQVESVSAEAQKKRYLFEDELLKTTFEVKTVYYEVSLLRDKIALTRQMLGLLNAGEVSVKSGLETGILKLHDLTMTQSEQARLRTEIINLEDSTRVLLARWRSALGVKPTEPLPPIPPSLQFSKHILSEEETLNQALANNVQLKALAQDIRQAEALVKLAYRENTPDFGVGLGADTKKKPWMSMPELSMTLPVWRTKISAEIAAARARESEARAMLSAGQLELVVMLAEKSFMWRELQRQTQLIEKQLIPLAEIRLRCHDTYYITGEKDFMDWLTAAQELLALKTELIEAIARREITFAGISLVVLSRQPEEAGKIIENQ